LIIKLKNKFNKSYKIKLMNNISKIIFYRVNKLIKLKKYVNVVDLLYRNKI